MRSAVPADATAIWAIHTRAIRETASSHYAPEAIAAWSGRTTPDSYLVPIATQVVLVACDAADRLAGFAELDPAEGLVKACYVDPDFDRRGVGRALMQAVERAAREHGRTALTLDASLNAVPFYRALGWQVECPTRHELAPGAWLDCAIMTKPLR